MGVLFDLRATRCAALLPLIRGLRPRTRQRTLRVRGSPRRRATCERLGDLERGEPKQRELPVRGRPYRRTCPCSRVEAPGLTLTGTPRCVGSSRSKSPERPEVARREAASFGPEGSVAAFEAQPRISGSNAAQRVACRSKTTPTSSRGAPMPTPRPAKPGTLFGQRLRLASKRSKHSDPRSPGGSRLRICALRLSEKVARLRRARGWYRGVAGTRGRSFRSTRNALRRVAAFEGFALERGNGPFGSEARRFAASNLCTVGGVVARGADATGSSRRRRSRRVWTMDMRHSSGSGAALSGDCTRRVDSLEGSVQGGADATRTCRLGSTPPLDTPRPRLSFGARRAAGASCRTSSGPPERRVARHHRDFRSVGRVGGGGRVGWGVPRRVRCGSGAGGRAATNAPRSVGRRRFALRERPGDGAGLPAPRAERPRPLPGTGSGAGSVPGPRLAGCARRRRRFPRTKRER